MIMDNIITLGVECELCNNFIEYKIELGNYIDLDHCDY